MRGIHASAVVILTIVVAACANAPQTARSTSGGQPSSAGPAADREQRVDVGPPPLGEFDTLTQPDVDLYLKVMRTAATRVQNLSPSDQAAIKTLRRLSSNPTAATMPSAEEMAAIQHAGELIVMDAVIAREMGVERRYSSISSRVGSFVMPMAGEGDATPMSADERAALQMRIQRFKELRAKDAATLEPYRTEIVSLQKQVNAIRF